jgi:hypothetical protein
LWKADSCNKQLCLRKISESEMLPEPRALGREQGKKPMARRLTPRSRRWLQWASGLLLIAAGGAQPLAAAAPPIRAGEARIWFYQYETRVKSRALIPTIVANGTYIGSATPGTVFYRDLAPGHYEITIPNLSGFKYGSAHFDLAAGQQPGSTHRASAPCSSPNKLRKSSLRT